MTPVPRSMIQEIAVAPQLFQTTPHKLARGHGQTQPGLVQHHQASRLSLAQALQVPLLAIHPLTLTLWQHLLPQRGGRAGESLDPMKEGKFIN